MPLTPAEATQLVADIDDAPFELANAQTLLGDWRVWARASQLPPEGDWRIWLLLAGRGFGKTRSGAEWVRAQAESGAASRIALVAPTARDARLVMVEGESGLLAIAPDTMRPVFEPSKRQLTWPNGAIATLFSADEPDRLRGPQFDAAWCDELAAWRYPQAWDMLMMALRLGTNPRVVVTTTPKPVKLVRALLASPDCAVTRGGTRDNAGNLAPGFLAAILKQYEGTRLGRQELDAELLEDMPGALWSRDAIERARIDEAPVLRRVVVAIDPAASAGEDADETGIVVAALGQDSHGYVLDDLSGRYSPHDWASRALEAYRARRADRIVAEVNNGGAMVEATLRVLDAGVSYKPVHASRGKLARAEPVAALYEQGRIHHVGAFPALEDQMCAFTGGPLAHRASPDRVDALVWALSELMLNSAEPALLSYYRSISAK
jgi:predicted phage terminase large subunit-like protein